MIQTRAAAVLGHLDRGVSVEIAGMPYSGRSAIARTVAERLASAGQRVLCVRGVPFIADVPAGALTVAGERPRQSPRDGAVDRVGLEDATVIVVDDAPAVDDLSIHRIVAQHVRRRVPVVAVIGTGAQSAHPLRGALSPSARVEAEPLRHAEADRLVRRRLGGGLDAGSLATVTNACGGLPGLVLAVVDAARANGTLIERNGLWTLEGEVWDGTLTPRVEHLLAPVPPEVQETLRLLALAGSLPVGQVDDLCDRDILDTLDQHGLVRALRVQGEWELSLFPPLVADHFLHQRTSLVRLQAEAMLDRLTIEHRRPAVTGPEPTAQPAGTTLLSHRSAQHWRTEAERRRAAWLADSCPATAVRYLSAAGNAAADPAVVDEVVARTPLVGPALDRMLYLGRRAAHLGIVRGDVDGAVALLEEHRATLPAFDAALRACQAHVRLVRGPMPTEDLLAPPAPSEHPLSGSMLRAVTAEVRVAQGRPQDARTLLAAADDGRMTAARDLMPDTTATRGLALILDCDLDAAIRGSLAAFDTALEALDVTWIDGHAYVSSLAMSLGARVADLEEHLATVSLLAKPPTLDAHFQTGVLAVAAVVADGQGRCTEALALAHRARAHCDVVGPHPLMDPVAVLHLIGTRAHGATPAAVDPLWHSARGLINQGYVTAGVLRAVAALERRPDPDRAHLLRQVAQQSQSALLRHVADYAVALATADPERLQTVSRELRWAGLRLYGVRAAVQAARRLRERGDTVASTRLAFETWELTHALGAQYTSLLDPLVHDLGVTEREREIASLLGGGASARDIAAALVLSVRTVEQHILRACRKLGVNSRADLALAARTWFAGRPGGPRR